MLMVAGFFDKIIDRVWLDFIDSDRIKFQLSTTSLLKHDSEIYCSYELLKKW